MYRPLTATIVAAVTLLLPQIVPGAIAESPSVQIEGCGLSGPRIDQGKTGNILGEVALKVEVPDEGTYFSLPNTPTNTPGTTLFICHIESGSSIVIDAHTGGEVTRTIGVSSGAAILDRLAANATVERPASSMSPPTTGNGGLK